MFQGVTRFAALLAAALLMNGLVAGQDEPDNASNTATERTSDTKRFLIAYDWSNSMWGELSDKSRKYESGLAALSELMGHDFAGRDIGLRTYGHRRKDDCRDSELLVSFGDPEATKQQINSAVQGLRPTGKTPITYSLREGLKDFDGHAGDILLISDGIETCDADPCELMREWQASNVDIKVHVVGVGLNDVERAAMTCIADESGGIYLDADSTEGFTEALNEVSEVIETADTEPTPIEGEPDTAEYAGSQAILVRAVDASGHEYRATGKLYRDGEEIAAVTSIGYGRNIIDGPGKYEIEVGPLLQDGTIYEPVRMPVSVSGQADTEVQVLVQAPARVSAAFTERGEPHRGAHVTAYRDGEAVFSFRAIDEAVVRPGTYEFRSEPNSDNPISLEATLPAGEATVLTFELVETVKAYVRFELPDGEVIRRQSALWKDGEKLYSVLSSNGATVRPGTYELRAEDQNLPLTPTEIVIDTTESKIYIVPLEAGWVNISYPSSTLYDYARKKLPTRATLHSLDRGGSKYSRPGKPIPVAPGRYAVEGFDNDGFFDRAEVDVAAGQTAEVIMTPKPLGELVMTFAPSDRYEKEPDRARMASLDGHRIIGGILTPDKARKLLPGRYRISGSTSAGEIAPAEVTVTAGERTEITLHLPSE